jgi:hypothetical protein
MTWVHTPAISPEQGALALIAIVIVYGLVWVVYRMLTYREPVEEVEEPHGDASLLGREARHVWRGRG